MSSTPSLPIELLIHISVCLRPHTPVIGYDAAWVDPTLLRNWWDQTLPSEMALPPENELKYSPPKDPMKSSYAPLLALRTVNREFNAICTPILYHDFNHLIYEEKNEQITTEVITRYHHHFRTVRISAERAISPEPWQRIYDFLRPHLSKRITALGVLFDNGIFSAAVVSWTDIVDDILYSLEFGCITSLGIYSSTAFTRYIKRSAPDGAIGLISRILSLPSGFNHVRSLDILLDRIDEETYDALRAQVTQLHSLTIRGALRRELERMWNIGQRNKWFTCASLTSLQLIHCNNACATHIPYILRFFPSLKTLFLSGCGNSKDIPSSRREVGWSFKQHMEFGPRSPLESLHLECIIDWEIAALGVLHTKKLIITTLISGDVINAFSDEEIFPCLHTLKIERRYLNPTIEATCAKRGINIESDAHALVFDRHA